MKKMLIASVIAGFFLGSAVINSVYADSSCTEPQRGTLSVSTSATSDISPDIVEINIAVKTKDSKSLQKASSENKQISDNVYSALKLMINPQNKDYIKTSDYNARPVYVYNSNNKKVLDKYEVSNNIIVHTKNIDKAGAIIDKALELGATDINDLKFSVSDYDTKCDSLLEEASKKAKNRADLVAKASGTYITGVKNISMSCSENTIRRVQYRVMSKSMMAGNAAVEEAATMDSATPIQSGNIKVYANMNIDYFIK